MSINSDHLKRGVPHVGPRCSFCGCKPDGEHSVRCGARQLVSTLVWAQAATFIGLGAAKFITGEWRLGGAQLLLAIITVLVYL